MTIRKRKQQIAQSVATDKAYSEAFVEAEIATTVPFQIRAMRREREWTQAELAERTDQQQKTISDFENPDIGPRSIASLRKIAAAFDVGLIVRFAPFSEMVDWSGGMTKANHFVPSREKDAKLRHQRTGGTSIVQYSTFMQRGFDFADTSQKVVRMSDWKDTRQPKLTTNSDTSSGSAIVKCAKAT